MVREIKYVMLDIVTSAGKIKQSKTGILTGIKIDKKEVFVSILEDVNLNLYFNTKRYYIKTVKIKHVDGLDQSFYEETEAEQIKAVAAVKSVILKLREAGIVDKEGGVDLKKYKDLPIKYTDKQPNSVFGLHNTNEQAIVKRLEKATTITNFAKVKAAKEKRNAYANGSYNNTYTKPEKKVTYIRRKTKKPSEKFLADLRKKVAQITKEEYKGKKLPEIINIDNDSPDVTAADVLDAEFAERERRMDEYRTRNGYGDPDDYNDYGGHA